MLLVADGAHAVGGQVAEEAAADDVDLQSDAPLRLDDDDIFVLVGRNMIVDGDHRAQQAKDLRRQAVDTSVGGFLRGVVWRVRGFMSSVG